MPLKHRASITWSDKRVDRGLPNSLRYIHPSWFPENEPVSGWSLVCEFEKPPSEQGNPYIAQVRYLFDEGPHERLQPGARLVLFEGYNDAFATVEILE